MSDIKNVLFWGDNPHGITGFGKVIKNIVRQVFDEEKYKIDVLGIGYMGDPYLPDQYNGKTFMYDVYTPFEVGKQIDLYGSNKLMSFLATGKVDILFILQDTFIIKNVMKNILELRTKIKKKFVIIYYYPIDNSFVYPNWITDAVSLVDIPVCYTEFGKKVSMKHDSKLRNMDVIYHGTDKNLYRKWDESLKSSMRTSFWGPGFDKKFIILNVNRNQPRKDLNRTLCVFAEVKKQIPEAFLFMLASPADIGGNLIDMGLQLGLKWGEDFMTPDPTKYNPTVGIPEEQIVTMYNTSDVCISTTLGEGWGLSLTEAMACGCPVIFPDNTSISEIIGVNENLNGIRGTLIHSGNDGNRICLGPPDNNLSRPLTSVMEMSLKIIDFYKHKNLYEEKKDLAIEWVPSWDKVGEQWREIFKQACDILEQRNGE